MSFNCKKEIGPCFALLAVIFHFISLLYIVFSCIASQEVTLLYCCYYGDGELLITNLLFH